MIAALTLTAPTDPSHDTTINPPPNAPRRPTGDPPPTTPTPTVCLYVTPHLEDADRARDDLELFLQRTCQLFPAWETLPGEGAASGEIHAERLRRCASLRTIHEQTPRHAASPEHADASPNTTDTIPAPPSTGTTPTPNTPPHAPGAARRSAPTRVIVAPIHALMQPVPTPDTLDRHTLHIAVGHAPADPDIHTRTAKHHHGPAPGAPPPLGADGVVTWLVDRGFERLPLVESPGDVAMRGDIVDVFAPGDAAPCRIQFFGDAVESIRRFDVGTQRSQQRLTSITITALPPDHPTQSTDDTAAPHAAQTTDLLTYLPADTLIVLDAPAEIHDAGRTFHHRLDDTDRLIPVANVLARCQPFTQLHLSRFGAAATTTETHLHLDVTSVARFDGDAADAVAELGRAARDHEVYVVCDNEGERSRLTEMLTEHAPDAPGRVNIRLGVMHTGFEWTATRTIVVPHHELFHRHRQRRRIRRIHAATPLESWTHLKTGERVVHVIHGIATYRGLHKMRKGGDGHEEEFLSLEFADRAMLHVPCSRIDLVQKYIGAGGKKPGLSTLGGTRWNKTKQQVADAVADLAESLLHVQAARQAATGTAYPSDTSWQREFEAAFPFEETQDQLTVAAEIRDDLMRPRPMDRLLCGDVGYGKTELAMRAAFKIVEYGRQAALLVPTTVLAEQHYATFRDRMADYPFNIACLSRFRAPSEQKRIVQRIKKGQVDIVIGTHRLLSRDIAFADLGLVIIDEEQRFGVEHKERLKAMRETVDVLTLTATPIPRTLHMALMGLRDISALQTPPVDRRSIATHVGPFDRRLIRDAIIREMNRDGQVYFVHNFVQSIAAMADTVRAIVPEARVVYGHGQMKAHQLEKVMDTFVRRNADVLVATTIIESGIDIPTVNTIFINRADRFGLADLHQLRGRVGRSSHRAYCYLLLAPGRPPTATAARRLKAIEEFSELGAGFRIAMRDLEIRGAGNLLGAQQSGHIGAVGYDMYCRLLDQTVRRLKNEPDPTPPPVLIDLDLAATIPPHYVASEHARLDVYRRLATCGTVADLDQLEADLSDAFGPIPPDLHRLLHLAELRVHARTFGIRSIRRMPPDVIFNVESFAQARPALADAPGTVRRPDATTVHMRPPPNYLEPNTLLNVLRHMFARATRAETPA
ncbi:MAG: transcription-repair coupling factor [Phycisphaerae bacterium]